MANKKSTKYFCDKCYERIPVVKGEIKCRHYRESELQNWCAMGRLADDCRVAEAMRREEEPSLNPRDYFREITKNAKAARNQLLALCRYLDSKEAKAARQRVIEVHRKIDCR